MINDHRMHELAAIKVSVSNLIEEIEALGEDRIPIDQFDVVIDDVRDQVAQVLGAALTALCVRMDAIEKDLLRPFASARLAT